MDASSALCRIGTWLLSFFRMGFDDANRYHAFLWGQMIYILPLIGAILALPLLLVGLLFQRTRLQSSFYLLISVIFIPCCIVGIVLGKNTRMASMKSFATRSQPLINAIQKYDLDHSYPPRSLNDLVPNYIPAVPTTGMMAYPEFCYHVGADCRKQYANNEWALTVATPSGGINFDVLLYFPNRNYPSQGYGGWLEPIGNWSYVHE